MRNGIALLLVAALALLRPATVSTGGGVIRGLVELPRPQAAAEPRPSAAVIGAPAVRPIELRPAVVYLTAAPRGAFELDDSARASMRQQDETFVPHVLAVTTGTTVEFPNVDATYHNVFSLSKTKAFDLGRYGRGASKSVRFSRPGVVHVFCEIHSHMSAYIVVFAHRFFAVTDAAGRFAIPDVPPGTYTLAVWYEGEVRDTRQITVPDAGGDVESNFVVR